jgi:hypothetical protein
MSEGQERYMFAATIDDKGTLHPDEVNATRGRLAKWKGRHVNVVVSRYVKSKTNPQLGLYFREGGILACWAEYIGDDPEAVHRDLKDAYLVPLLAEANEFETNKITGEMRPKTPSLADVSVEIMSSFLSRIIREGAQRGIEFPLDGASS